MGGIFGGGSAPVPQEEPIEEDLSEENAREDRLEMIRRRRRGRAGTVHTSWTGDKVEIPDELKTSTGKSSDDETTSPPAPQATSNLNTTLGG